MIRKKQLKGEIIELRSRLDMLEDLLYHEESKYNGFAVLKRHLNRPDKPLPRARGKIIKQD